LSVQVHELRCRSCQLYVSLARESKERGMRADVWPVP
jgi:hypothetical protein